MSRIIFHIDVNSAYLSWTAVEQLKSGATLDIRTIPAIIGGDRKSRHGVVLAKSIPAKKYGIHTGEPVANALRKCPDIHIEPPDHALYHEYSRRLMEFLHTYTPDIEQVSVDECYLDFTGIAHRYHSCVSAAFEIKDRVREKFGFTVNIGISSNKLLAKMASDFEKPDRCHTLFPQEIPEKMWPLPIHQLFFVGDSAGRKLENLGIHTIGDLARCDLSLLKHHLGEKYAVLIHQYANGIDPEPVAEREPLNKGYGNSVTLAQDVTDLPAARQVLLSLCETVGARLRADHILCGNLCVELKDWRFNTRTHQMNLPEPTDSTSILYRYSCRLLEECWDRTPLRLMGVRAGKIQDEEYRQMSLFESEADAKRRKLESAVDQIRSRYGVDSIKRASFLRNDSIVDHAASKKKHLSGPSRS